MTETPFDFGTYDKPLNDRELPRRLVTFEIFDQTEKFRFSEKFQIFGNISDFRKNFRFSEKFQIFGKFLDFWKISRFSEKI